MGPQRYLSVFTSCADQSSSGATPEEIHYRNQATSLLYAFVVKVKQSSRYSPSNRQLFTDLISSLNNLEPVPPRFQDVHYSLIDALTRVNDYLLNTPASKYDSDYVDQLENDMLDALDDYQLVVGISVPSLR